jgi:hypothetical protein
MIAVACFLGLFISVGAFARSDLKQVMAGTCDQMGDTQGVRCVELQRQLEGRNVEIDRNGAGICSLIWQWGSHNKDQHPVGNLVLSCFKAVSNLHVSNETRDTCNESVYARKEFRDPIEVIQNKTKKMMNCIRQLGVPVIRHKRS